MPVTAMPLPERRAPSWRGLCAARPEVVVKVTGRQRGGSHVKAHLEYIGRKGDVEIETRDGESQTAKEDIA